MSDSEKLNPDKSGKDKLHTDSPLSEKDEVKQAEHKVAKVQKATKSIGDDEVKKRKHNKD